MEIIWFIVGALAGAGLVALFLRGREERAETRAAEFSEQLGAASADRQDASRALTSAERELAELRATLTHERTTAREKAELLDHARAELSDRFKALSSDALERNNRSFMALARTTLERFQVEARDDLDKRRTAVCGHAQADQGVARQGRRADPAGRIGPQQGVRLVEPSRSARWLRRRIRLRSETTNLVTALRAPAVRGRWGEMQLRRVVETAGMLEHCDFSEQVSSERDGHQLRPDLVVKLPGGQAGRHRREDSHSLHISTRSRPTIPTSRTPTWLSTLGRSPITSRS